MVEKEKELGEIVGSKNILTSANALEEYSKDFSFVSRVRPRCLVKPKNADEIQAIVKWANDTCTPLVPVSSGLPRFRGDTVPSAGGAVVVDLSRMKKIITVDSTNKVAIVEPGVTFGELVPELEKSGLTPLTPLMPRSNKSVVTSALETEPITTPTHHWEAQDPLSCVEVIFGNGELFRTGEAAGPGELEEQQKSGKAMSRGTGPANADFTKLVQCAQGTVGIVTWASIRCKTLTETRKAFLVPSEDLGRLVELVYKLMWRRLGDVCLILNNLDLACLLKTSNKDILTLSKDLPPWVLVFTIEPTGILPDEKLECYEAEFNRWAQSFGLKPTSVISEVKTKDIAKMLYQTSLEPYWKLRLKGGVQELFFLTTMDRTPELVKRFYALAGTHKYPTGDMGVYIQPLAHGSSCHCEFDLFYDPRSAKEVDIVKKVFFEGARELAKADAFFSRPYGALRDIMYPHVTAPFVNTQRKIKNIFDPNNVMNTGKLFYV